MSAIHGQVLVDTLCGNAAYQSSRMRRIIARTISWSVSIAQASKTISAGFSNYRIRPEQIRSSGCGSIFDAVNMRMEIDDLATAVRQRERGNSGANHYLLYFCSFSEGIIKPNAQSRECQLSKSRGISFLAAANDQFPPIF